MKSRFSRWVSPMVVGVGLLGPLACHAASFDCARASSLAERAICSDASLSRLDDDLASAWKQALAGGGNVNARKTAQRDWLKQRDACRQDTQCLADCYYDRLIGLYGELDGTANRWRQSWSKDINSATSGGELILIGTPPNLHFTITANSGSHEGALEGDVILHGDHATFHQDNCQLDFTRKGAHIQVEQKGMDADCGAGMGVYYGGNYIPTTQFKLRAKPDLLNLKVVADARQNDAVRALLGKDYKTLVETINVWSDQEDDRDGLGAKVIDGFVRGLANTNAFIMMTKGESLWIGLLVFDTHNQVHMRYYTNVPTWKKHVPKTIQSWHDNIDENMPVDRMP